MRKMIAKKSFRYGTQRISVGDIFDVRDNHVKILQILGRAKDFPRTDVEHGEIAIPEVVHLTEQKAQTPVHNETTHQNQSMVAKPVVTVDTEEQTVIDNQREDMPTVQTHQEEDQASEENQEGITIYGKMLRDRARSMGIRVDGRWSDARVQREIDEHNKRTYQRADLTAARSDE